MPESTTAFTPEREDSLAPRAAEVSGRGQPLPDSSYQNYLFGHAGSGDTPAWSDSRKGRFAIRMISRGVVGAAFFTIGGRIATNHLKGYDPNKAWDRSKPLQAVAKGIDLTFGKIIEGGLRSLARLKHTEAEAAEIAKKAMTFRDSRHFPESGFEHGRSYGAETVGFTFDFAMASIGDASTRNIIQAFDPNVKKSWLVNDAGKPAAKGERAHVLWGEWAKSVGRTTWRIFSKNQGEDWAAAIPYAFQMKFQRQFLTKILDKRFEGHQVVFDHSWNGGAYKVKDGRIVGDYQLVGALDLHARFVGYNWYTLMFREGYDKISNAFDQWKKNDYKINLHVPQHVNPLTATLDGIGNTARYVTKSFIKANMYMNPAVVPFWLIRVPQSKWRGRQLVDVSQVPAGGDASLMKQEMTRVYNNTPTDLAKGELNPFHPGNYAHYPNTTWLDKAERGFSRYTNWIGAGSYKLGSCAADGVDWMAKKSWIPEMKWTRTFVENPVDRRKFMHELTDASLAYTPYMFAKQETALLVDDRKGDGSQYMDGAIYRFMDDVAGFKFKALPKDVKTMWKLATNFERDIPVREGDVPEPLPTKPVTTVAAKTLTREHPVVKPQTPAANDARWTDKTVKAADTAEAANDAEFHHDKQWAQAVVGSDINAARFHAASPTRH